jgi:hypothetical protein
MLRFTCWRENQYKEYDPASGMPLSDMPINDMP